MMDCADALRKLYAEAMKDYEGSTLSVGIAIAHALEPLEDVRQWAFAAEQSAKNKNNAWPGACGNALALHWHTRSGSPMQLRGNWADENDTGDRNDLLGRLRQWTACLADGLLSDKSAFALEGLAKSYSMPNAKGEWVLKWGDAAQASEALKAQTKQLIAHSEATEEAAQKASAAIELAFTADQAQPHRALMHLAREWQIARNLLKAEQQGQKSKQENRA
jgi:CRISPR-associated protein Cmr2